MSPSRRTGSKGQFFAAGCFGTVVVYAVFFLRHAEVVSSFVDDFGSTFVAAAVGALLVLVAAAGLWTLFNEPKALKTAFSLGLGAPAMFFAADLAPSAPAAGEATPAGRPPILAAGVLLVGGVGSGSVGEALRLVFAPMSAVAEQSVRQVNAEAADLRQEVPKLAAELEQASRERDRLQHEVQSLTSASGQRDELEAEVARLASERERQEASFREQLTAATRQQDQLRQQVARLAATREELQQQVRAMEKQTERLTGELAATRNERDRLQAQIERLRVPEAERPAAPGRPVIVE